MLIGLIRKVDKLGRLVIPKEYRELYKLNCGDQAVMITTPEGILLTNPKYRIVEVNDEKKQCE